MKGGAQEKKISEYELGANHSPLRPFLLCLLLAFTVSAADVLLIRTENKYNIEWYSNVILCCQLLASTISAAGVLII